MKAKLSCAVLFILFLGILQWCEGRGVEQEGQPLIQLSHGKLSNKPVKLFIICICIPSYAIVSIVLELDGMLKKYFQLWSMGYMTLGRSLLVLALQAA